MSHNHPPPSNHHESSPSSSPNNNNNNNNNNNTNMERVFYNLHTKLTTLTLRHTSHKFRSFIEHMMLVLAVCSFSVVLLSHKTFVYRTHGILSYYSCSGGGGEKRMVVGRKKAKVIPTQCLKSVRGWKSMEDDEEEEVDVMHIVIQQHWDGSIYQKDDDNDDSVVWWRNKQKRFLYGGVNETEKNLGDGGENVSFAYMEDLDENGLPPRWNGFNKNYCIEKEEEETTAQTCIPSSSSNVQQQQQQQRQQPIIFSYSKTKGFLLLPPSIRQKHSIKVQTLYINPTDVKCFGEPFLQTLIFGVLGNPDTVIYNWILALHYHHDNNHNHHHKEEETVQKLKGKNGYVYNARTKSLTDLSYFEQNYHFLVPRQEADGTIQQPSSSWQNHHHQQQQDSNNHHRRRHYSNLHFLLQKATILLTSISLFFITTTLVSFTLRQTQYKMLGFTIALSDHVRNEMPLGKLVVVHVVENLVFVPIMVGVVFFLIEFYKGDKFLAFMVLSLVWVGEAYSVISMRSIQTTKHFPCAFFLYFTLFHVYFFSCPFGFSYSSLGSTVLFVLHAMIFFWNRYEIPAFLNGSVTLDSPRMMQQHQQQQNHIQNQRQLVNIQQQQQGNIRGTINGNRNEFGGGNPNSSNLNQRSSYFVHMRSSTHQQQQQQQYSLPSSPSPPIHTVTMTNQYHHHQQQQQGNHHPTTIQPTATFSPTLPHNTNNRQQRGMSSSSSNSSIHSTPLQPVSERDGDGGGNNDGRNQNEQQQQQQQQQEEDNSNGGGGALSGIFQSFSSVSSFGVYGYGASANNSNHGSGGGNVVGSGGRMSHDDNGGDEDNEEVGNDDEDDSYMFFMNGLPTL